MLNNNITVQIHEELILQKEALCPQFESTNPFFGDDDFELFIDNFRDNKISCRPIANESLDSELSKILEVNLWESEKRTKRNPDSAGAQNALAQDLIRLNKLDEAELILKSIIRQNKDFLPAISNLARCYLKKGNPDEAIKIYQHIVESDSKDVRILEELALVVLSKGDQQKALDLLSKAIKLAPNNSSLLNNTGIVYLSKNNLSQAISFFRRAIKIRKDDALIYNNLGVAYTLNKNINKGIVQFKIAYNLDKWSECINRNLASAYQEIGEHDKSADLLELYIQKCPQDIDAMNILAWSYFQLKKYSKCFDFLKKAYYTAQVDDRSKRATFLNNIGVVYGHLNKSNLARDSFLKALDTYKKDPVIWYNLIDYYINHNLVDKSLQTTKDATEKFPNDLNLIYYLAKCYTMLSEYDLAKESLNKGLEIQPENLPFRLLLSTIVADADENPEHALDILRPVYEKGIKLPGFVNNFAYFLINLNRIQEADQLLEKYWDDNDIFLNATRGLLNLKQGQLEIGRYFYNKAIKLAELNPVLTALIQQKKHLEVGRHFLRENLYELAKKEFKKGLKFSADTQYYRVAIQKALEDMPPTLFEE